MDKKGDAPGAFKFPSGDKNFDKFVLHTFATANNLKDFLELEKHCNSEELREILLSKDDDDCHSINRAAQHASVEFFEYLWSFIQKNLNRNDQKFLLRSRNHFEHNVLMISYQNIDNSVPKAVFELFEKTLSSQELREALEEKNFVGDSVLSLIFKSGSSENINECLKQLKSALSANEIRSLLLAISPSLQQNILHRLICNEDEAAVPVAWKFTTNALSVNEIKTLLLFEDTDSDNMFFRAALKDSPLLLISLKWFSENSTHDQLVSVVNNQNRNKRTLLHYLALISAPKSARMFFEFASITFSKSELLIFFSREDDKGDNPLKWSLYNEDESTACVFWKAYGTILDPEDFVKLLFKNGNFCLKFDNDMNQNAVSKVNSLAVEKFGKKIISERSTAD